MPEENITYVKNFVILGFPGLPPNYYGLASVVMFCVYVCTLMGNGIFFALFLREKSLKKPMYYIMLNLAVSDVLFSTTTLPKIIARYWFDDGSISYAGCFIQMQFVHYFASVNALVLAVMAFDRYVAVCNPLRYANIVKESTILGLCVASWLLPEASVLLAVINATSFPYCASNTIIQCYCDYVAVTKLSCNDRTPYAFSALLSAMIMLLIPLAFILFSYGSIIVTVFQTSSTRGRLKTLSTCSSQLIIITLYFLPRCSNHIYSFLHIQFSADVQILVIMLYSLLPPMINPLIYCLKTKEAKECLKKHLNRSSFVQVLKIQVKVSTLSK